MVKHEKSHNKTTRIAHFKQLQTQQTSAEHYPDQLASDGKIR
jgi:hypothetical protein